MKYTVGIKIAMMNAIAIISLILIAFANYYSTDKLVDNTNWRQHAYLVKKNLAKLQASLIDAETGERGYLLTKQSRYLEPYQLSLTEIQAALDALKSLRGDNADQQKKLDDLSVQIKYLLAIMQQSIKSTDSKQIPDLMDSGKKNMDDIRKTIKEMDSVEDGILVIRVAGAESSIQVAFYTIILGTIFAVSILALLGFYITRDISRPLGKLTEAASQIARGNLNILLPPTKRKDEIGVLMKTFGIMLMNLKQLTVDLVEAITVLGKSANEISISTVQLSTSAAEMAAAVGETTSTIEEVKQTSILATEKSKSVSESSQKAADISKDGKKSTLETNDLMVKVKDKMISIAESMMRLSEQTQAISSIITTVDDLAQQSNILAVNASIEAEKAGENGKGFRIVAQEIKNLSDQSKHATGRVREILSDVQKATNTAVLSTEQGTKVVETGVQKSVNTGGAIDKLDKSISLASQAAIQIAATSQQQLVGMEQAAAAMENIKLASTQNVESAKQLEVAANNINTLGSKLQKLVAKYHVNKNTDETGAYE